MFEIQGKYNIAKVFATTVDNECIAQIIALCNQKWLESCDISIMPDCHAGKGCTIGTTICLKDKICPALVGQDIGCGMLVINIPEQFKLNLSEIDKFINMHIPSGFEVNENILYDKITGFHMEKFRCFQYLKKVEYLKKSIGSLGGGNHFVEINQDDSGNHYLVIHSGSRNLGCQVAKYYQDVADEYCNREKQFRQIARRELIESLKQQKRYQEINAALHKFDEQYQVTKKIPHDLCYIEGKAAEDYLHDAALCTKFATLNRLYIAKQIMEFIVKDNGYHEDILNIFINESKPHQFEFRYVNNAIDGKIKGFETIHNYIGADNILRKGAISAQKGEKVIIPINMREGSMLGIGKGNSDYNYSGPHGAGRLLSRGEAKECIGIKEFRKAMEGIYSTSVCQSTIDESPMVYKDLKEIMINIEDSVNVTNIIHPLYNFKAH